MSDKPETDEQFTPFGSEQEESETPARYRILRAGVLKTDQLKEGASVCLEPENVEEDQGVEFFQPVYDGNTVVGVIHKCACGRTSELRFEYQTSEGVGGREIPKA